MSLFDIAVYHVAEIAFFEDEARGSIHSRGRPSVVTIRQTNPPLAHAVDSRFAAVQFTASSLTTSDEHKWNLTK